MNIIIYRFNYICYLLNNVVFFFCSAALMIAFIMETYGLTYR